jgi:hypothetical protein
MSLISPSDAAATGPYTSDPHSLQMPTLVYLVYMGVSPFSLLTTRSLFNIERINPPLVLMPGDSPMLFGYGQRAEPL